MNVLSITQIALLESMLYNIDIMKDNLIFNTPSTTKKYIDMILAQSEYDILDRDILNRLRELYINTVLVNSVIPVMPMNLPNSTIPFMTQSYN